jgi:hypothetical protein
MGKLGFVLYSVLLALWTGGIVTFTFLVTPAIFKHLGRDIASAVLDRLFAVYFPYNLVVAAAILLCLLGVGHLLTTAGRTSSLALAVVAVLTCSFVQFKLYPDIKQTKAAISSFEQTDPSSPERAAFRRLHGISAGLNLLLLADGLCLVIIAAVARK